ncbi:chymotrypsin-like [Convolutriloba macropyga]|uniref:chymotrypsin-like n=1 Tax=Convolutriloba macropyga TaxID=536237 RepID=UPI003F522A70
MYNINNFSGRGAISIKVQVGDFSRKNRGRHTYSATATIHANYDAESNENDIAVLKLTKAVPSSRVLPLCQKSYSDKEIAVCGMGQTDGSDEDSLPSFLMETRLRETYQCRFSNFDPSTHVCLRSEDSEQSGSCMGDSGGPAFPLSTDKQTPICVYGVVSFGNKYCSTDSVFTRVSAYRDWIKKQMQN